MGLDVWGLVLACLGIVLTAAGIIMIMTAHAHR